MKAWFLIDERRLAEERDSVAALAATEDWFALERWEIQKGLLTVRGVISVHDKPYPVQLTWPDQFPDVPPWVRPVDPARWSAHQFGTSELCLQLRPDNWVPTARGADMLRSAHALLTYEQPLGENGVVLHAPSAHHVSALQAYGEGILSAFVGAACVDRLRAGSAIDAKALVLLSSDTLLPIVITDHKDRQSIRRVPATGHLTPWKDTPIYIVRSAVPEETTRQSIAVAGQFSPEVADVITGGAEALTLFCTGDALTAYFMFENGKPHVCELIVLPEQQGIRSGRAEQSTDKRVAVIGGGSLGAKVADSLVRSGVSALLLGDGDVLLPVNLERHVLTWRGVGFRKVDALKRHLLEIAPGATIETFAENLSWQRSARAHSHLISSIAVCDVIVDATGDAGTALFLGAVAASNQRVFVSSVVFEGGIGARIACCIPGRDPPFATARASFQAWCEAQNVPPPKTGTRPYEALDEDAQPLVADDAAVTMTAGHTARVILDFLDGNAPGRESAWLLLGYRKGWLFNGHGDSIRLSVGEPLPEAPTEENKEITEWLGSLLAEFLRENKTGK